MPAHMATLCVISPSSSSKRTFFWEGAERAEWVPASLTHMTSGAEGKPDSFWPCTTSTSTQGSWVASGCFKTCFLDQGPWLLEVPFQKGADGVSIKLLLTNTLSICSWCGSWERSLGDKHNVENNDWSGQPLSRMKNMSILQESLELAHHLLSVCITLGHHHYPRPQLTAPHL